MTSPGEAEMGHAMDATMLRGNLVGLSSRCSTAQELILSLDITRKKPSDR